MEVKALGAVPVKGLGARVEVYEVTGAGAARSRLQAPPARADLLCRPHADVEQLWKALEEARTGHGQLVAAVGEPGVGKARSFHEFPHSAHSGIGLGVLRQGDGLS
jgi:hypothetical protein